MRFFHPHGSKERLFEMIGRVNNVVLSEDNQDILDFLKTVKADYPDDDNVYSKFLSLAKRKGVDVAKREYDNAYSPQAIKNKAKADSQHQRTINKLDSHNQVASKYSEVINIIQYLIQTHGLYNLILGVFQRSNPSKNLLNLISNKKYSNLFNHEIKDLTTFKNKYLRSSYGRDLIPLESIELMEYKPKGWEKEYGEKFGLTLLIKSFIISDIFNGKGLDVNDFLFFTVYLDPDLDSQIMSTSGYSHRNVGAEYKFKKFEDLARKYNRKRLTIIELAQFLTDFLNIYNKPDKYFQEKILSRLNEEVLPIDKKNIIMMKFIDFVNKKLDLDDAMPDIKISYDAKEAQDMKSFGKYTPETNELRVVAINRNLADVLRTLAHELIHNKQRKEGVLKPNSSDTGSEHENEANALAGVLMREFGQKNPIIFE